MAVGTIYPSILLLKQWATFDVFFSTRHIVIRVVSCISLHYILCNEIIVSLKVLKIQELSIFFAPEDI